MKRSGGGGLGFVVAIVGLVIVLFLVAKKWNAVLPAALQALAPGGAAAQVKERNQRQPGGAAPASATRPNGMPDLNEMGANTDAHIQQVEDAAAGQD